MKSPFSTQTFAAITAFIFVGAINQAHAQAFREWTGSETNWNGSGVWNGGYSQNAQLEWKGGGDSTSWNNRGTQDQWRFYFTGSKAYTLGGDAVNFFDVGGANAGILSDSTALQTINLNVSFRDSGARTAFILTRNTGALTFGGSVEVTNSVTALGIGSSNSSGIVTFSGAITGNKPVVVGTNSLAGDTSGMGETRVVFAGNNSYTGQTTVERGALTITHNNALGDSSAGTVVKGNAVLRLSNNITVASEALTLSGGGFSESGALRSISGSNNFDGLITLSGGNTYLAAASGATLKVSAISGGANELWVVGDGTTILGSGATNSGSGTALVKSNVGTLILSASNAWSGAEFIREGNVVLNHNNALGVGGTTTLGATAGSATATLQYGSNITNSNAVTVQATGTGQRTLSYQSDTGTGEQAGNVTLNNALTVDVASGGTFRISGVVSGTDNGLTKSSAGTLILSGNNSYTGATTINAGTLRLGADNRIASGSAVSVASGATFDLNNFDDNVGGISGAGNITLGTGNLSSTVAANAEFSGAITGSGSFTKAGANTLTLSGASSDYSGSISITAGALRVSNANALGNTTGGTTASTGALELIGGVSVGSEALSLSADGVSAGGALRNISGDNSWAGTVTIAGTDTRINSNDGTLSLNGALNLNNNTVYIGGAGNVTIGGVIQNGGKTTSNGALWWDGTGALRINTAPTLLSGNISLRRGTVLLGVDNALGEGAITAGAQGEVMIASANTEARSMGNNITMSTSDTLNLGQATGGTGNLTLGGSLVFGLTSANHFINVAASSTKATINGIVSGTGKNLIKEGAGTLSLSANNSYTGGTFIDAGVVEFTAGTSAASAIEVGTTTAGVTDSAATLRLAPSGNYTLNQNITVRTGGARTIEAANTAGTATLGGNLTLGKNVDIRAASGGTLALNGNITGDFTVGKRGAGTVTLGGTAAQATKFDLWEGELVASSVSNLGNNAGAFIGNKLFFGGGGLGVTGNVTLGGANGITVGAVGGTIRVATGNTLTLQGYINDQDNTGVILSKTGAGTLFFDKTEVNDLNGTTIKVAEGTFNVWNTGLLPAGLQLGDTATSGTFRYNNGDAAGSYSGNVAVNAGGGAIEVAQLGFTSGGAISGSGNLSKTGSGSLTLTGNSGYSGDLTVSAGTLQLNRTGGASLGSVDSIKVNSTATLLISQSNQVNNSAAEVTLSGGTITRASGVSEIFGNLNLTDASFLSYGTGTVGMLTFGSYTPSALLTVSNFGEGNALKFGSDIGSFLPTGGALSNSFFSFDNGFSYNNSTFTITAIPEPSTYLAAAGLLALFLWPVRRRLLKDTKSILGLRPSGRDRSEAYRNV